MRCRGCGLVLLAWVWAMPAMGSGPIRCLTYEEKSLGRLHTVCADGTRGLGTYNRTLDRWDTTITAPPGQTCTSAMNGRTQQVEVRCR